MRSSPGDPASRRERLFTGASVASRSFELLVAAAAFVLAVRVAGHVPFRESPLAAWPTIAIVAPLGIAAVTLYSLTTLTMGHQKTCLNVGSGAAFAVVLALPPNTALPVAFAGMLAAQLIRRYRGRQRLTLPTIAFNQAQYVVTWALASAAYSRLILDVPKDGTLALWGPAAGAALVYMFVNTWLVATWTALRRRAWAWDVWVRLLHEMAPGYSLALGAGAGVAHIATRHPLLGLLALGAALGGSRALLSVTTAQRREIVVTLGAIVETAERRSAELAGHSDRVSWWAERVARHLGVSEEAADIIAMAAKLHDLGKAAMGLPVGEEDRADNGSVAAARLHPIVASDTLVRCRGFDTIARYVRSQGEWFDGTGYPDGRAGSAIPLASRIIAVADAYDTWRCRHHNLQDGAAERALEHIHRDVGTRFDPAVVYALEAVVNADLTAQAYRSAFPRRSEPAIAVAFAGATGGGVASGMLPDADPSVDDWEHEVAPTRSLPWDPFSSRDRRRSRSLLEVQEAERRHVARELHDEIGGTLAQLSCVLTTTPACATRCGARDAQAIVRTLMQRVHDLSLDLRPTLLDDVGLGPTLQWYTERYASRTGIQVRLIQASLERRFDPAVETVAYRIVQETLTNAAKHAQASEITVAVHAEHGVMAIMVCDNGVGFDLEAIRRSGQASGLVGIRERAALIGGSVSVTSRPGAGTKIEASLPIARLRR
jgi:signal transduction histidine kinase